MPDRIAGIWCCCGVCASCGTCGILSGGARLWRVLCAKQMLFYNRHGPGDFVSESGAVSWRLLSQTLGSVVGWTHGHGIALHLSDGAHSYAADRGGTASLSCGPLCA